MPSATRAIDTVLGDFLARPKRITGPGPMPEFWRSFTWSSAPARRPSLGRMARAGAAHGKAIFKLVRTGGTQSRGGLRGQMRYVFNDEKLARVIDPSGRVGRFEDMTAQAMEEIITNWATSWWSGTRNGHTSHLILSFPQNATIDQVEHTTRDVLEELLEVEGRTFKYVVGIHDDTEHHPHAHVIVNRRADDRSLFTLRSGTELSYERFREAMAEHGAQYGLQLDPTFRFERGIIARQPSYEEQRAAHKEGRSYIQRPRTGVNLEEHKELISYAQIAYQALSVVAYNADCATLEAHFSRLSAVLADEGVATRPELPADALERFEKTLVLYNDHVVRAQAMVAARDAAERVFGERALSEVMQAFTALSPDAPYARDLHRPPEANTLYMHKPGDRPEAVHSQAVQQTFRRLEQDYGLSAAALTARLEGGARSHHLETLWGRDDLARVAVHEGLSLDCAGDRRKALSVLDDAYAEARALLVAARALAPLPHLDPDHEIAPPERGVYQYMEDRTAEDLAVVLQEYRAQGAPHWWIDESKPAIEAILKDISEDCKAAFLRTAPELAAELASLVVRDGAGGLSVTDAGRRRISDLDARGLLRESIAATRTAVGIDVITRYPTIPYELADQLTDAYMTVLSLETYRPESDRDRSGPDSDGDYGRDR